MGDRPYVLLSCAMSIDGYIDDTGPARLILSNAEDLDRVDEVRAGCDAVLVGASTVRRDDPRLTVKSEARRAARLARGVPADPVKVTVTEGGDLDRDSRFFTTGAALKLVYAPTSAVPKLRERLGDLAVVVQIGPEARLDAVLEDLSTLGVRRLLIEGGGSIHTQILAAGLADELHLVVAPFFVGDPSAPRFVQPAAFPQRSGAPMQLVEVRRLGDVALLRYLLEPR